MFCRARGGHKISPAGNIVASNSNNARNFFLRYVHNKGKTHRESEKRAPLNISTGTSDNYCVFLRMYVKISMKKKKLRSFDFGRVCRKRENAAQYSTWCV